MCALRGHGVLVLDPSSGFVVVSFPCPLPHRLKDGTIDILKGFLAHDVLMIACPSRDERVELQNQVPSRRGLVFFHECTDFL